MGKVWWKQNKPAKLCAYLSKPSRADHLVVGYVSVWDEHHSSKVYYVQQDLGRSPEGKSVTVQQGYVNHHVLYVPNQTSIRMLGIS